MSKNNDIIDNKITEIIFVGRSDLDDYIGLTIDSLNYNNYVKKLWLSNMFIRCIEMKKILDVFMVNTSIEELNLSNNTFEYGGIEMISDIIKIPYSHIRCIILSWNQIGYEKMNILASAIKINTSIRVIDLSYNLIGNEGVICLSDALKINKSIRCIDLCNNRIGNEGMISLSETLKINSSIETIYLHKNEIENEGIKVFAETLKVNSHLSTIYLSGNIFGYDVLYYIVNSLQYHNYSIESIHITDALFYGSEYISEIRKLLDSKNRKQRIIEWMPWKNHHVCSKLEPMFHDIVMTLLYLFFIPQIFLRREKRKLRQRKMKIL